MKHVTYRAPAKVILSGEHAVVYGKPALVSGIALYSSVTITESKDQQKVPNAFQHIVPIVQSYLKKEDIEFTETPFSFEMDIQVPLGRGLGSSAALSVAAIAALLEFYTGKQFDKETVNNLAYQVEKHFHGNPSGADNTTCCFGGLIFFRKEFEFLKTISALNFKLPETIESHLYLIDTGKPFETTADMVKQVAQLYNQNAPEVESVLSTIEKATKRMVVAIVKEDLAFFKDAMHENQKMLEQLDIVSDRAKDLLAQLQQFGTGKVTGAGGKKDGSGFILFFADNAEALESYLTKHSITFYKFQQDYKGLEKI